MNPYIDEDLAMLAEQARRFATERVAPGFLERDQTRVLDRAMQVFGAVGLTPDTPLAQLWSWGRALRFMDGPDEVHLRAIARQELVRSRAHRGENVLHLRRWMPPEGGIDG